MRITFSAHEPVDMLRLVLISAVVFNIGSNKYRLIASIHFNRSKVYIRHVLTHAEYDRGGWKK
ncbi:type II toxin-antitoxin system HigB family toxin [Candidatus Poribacteria bacterium]|nr:type II toxin-antitoxin system HigB family toxin [Candidatus Poribacteria bacterium]